MPGRLPPRLAMAISREAQVRSASWWSLMACPSSLRGVQVDHGRQIHRAFTGGDVGDIAAPGLIGPFGGELASNQIRDGFAFAGFGQVPAFGAVPARSSRTRP